MDIIKRYKHAYFFVILLIVSTFGVVCKTSATIYEYDQNSHMINEYTSSGNLYTYDYDLNGNLLKKSFYNNLALNKPSTAESYNGTNLPSKANDADQTNNGYWGVELQGSSKWWKVDLEDVYEVKKVVVRNYVDGTRFYKYKVEASVDGLQWTEIVNKSDDSTATDQGEIYTINSINARYLRVVMLSNSANTGVHLTDFRVYGDHASLALNKPSTAESYSGTNLPSKANDADQTNNGYWGVDLQGSSKWWKVDLEDVYEVKKVVVRNYVDGTRYYKYKVEVSVDGLQWTEIVNKSDDSIATDQGEIYTINSINARYLRVVMLSNSANTGVHLTDFRVYGDHASLALNKPSTAESYSGTNLPSKANDADQTNNGYWGVELQGSSKWWKVDLEDVYEVKKVVVRNYVDGTRYYKYKVEVSVDGLQWTEIVNKSDDSIATDQGEIYTINSINARYLRVVMLSNSANTGVHLTDFRVYGIGK